VTDLSWTELSSTPVRCTGAWDRQPVLRWRGVAVADEPIVAIAFLTTDGHVEWCKGERPRGSTVEIDLALLPYDELRLDVQVNVMIAGAYLRCRSRVRSAEQLASIGGEPCATGRMHEFARVEGQPPVICDVLFVAGRDVQVRRSGLWRVRSAIVDRLTSPLRDILTRGRTGSFET
jgi:hypothetical protein